MRLHGERLQPRLLRHVGWESTCRWHTHFCCTMYSAQLYTRSPGTARHNRHSLPAWICAQNARQNGGLAAESQGAEAALVVNVAAVRHHGVVTSHIVTLGIGTASSSSAAQCSR